MNNLSLEKLYLRIKQIHESIFEDCPYIKISDFYQFSSFKEKIKKLKKEELVEIVQLSQRGVKIEANSYKSILDAMIILDLEHYGQDLFNSYKFLASDFNEGDLSLEGIIIDLYNSNRDVVRKLFFKKFLSKEQQQKYLDILSVCIEQNNMTQAERIEQIMIHHIAQVILSHRQSFNEQTTKEDVLEFIQENNFSTIEI